LQGLGWSEEFYQVPLGVSPRRYSPFFGVSTASDVCFQEFPQAHACLGFDEAQLRKPGVHIVGEIGQPTASLVAHTASESARKQILQLHLERFSLPH